MATTALAHAAIHFLTPQLPFRFASLWCARLIRILTLPNRAGGGKRRIDPYTELDVQTGFSLLRGASLAEELVATASALGMPAIGVADRNTVAGVVRAHQAARAGGRARRRRQPAGVSRRHAGPDLLPEDRAA